MIQNLLRWVTAITPGVSKNLLSGIGTGAIVMWLFTKPDEKLCVGYEILAAACLILWIVQRGVSKIE